MIKTNLKVILKNFFIKKNLKIIYLIMNGVLKILLGKLLKFFVLIIEKKKILLLFHLIHKIVILILMIWMLKSRNV